MIRGALGSIAKSALGLLDHKLVFEGIKGTGTGGQARGWESRVLLYMAPGDQDYLLATILHELGHIVDYEAGPRGAYCYWSTGCLPYENSPWVASVPSWQDAVTYNGLTSGYVRDYSTRNVAEDFADTFMWRIYNSNSEIPYPSNFNIPNQERQDTLTVALSQFMRIR